MHDGSKPCSYTGTANTAHYACTDLTSGPDRQQRVIAAGARPALSMLGSSVDGEGRGLISQSQVGSTVGGHPGRPASRARVHLPSAGRWSRAGGAGQKPHCVLRYQGQTPAGAWAGGSLAAAQQQQRREQRMVGTAGKPTAGSASPGGPPAPLSAQLSHRLPCVEQPLVRGPNLVHLSPGLRRRDCGRSRQEEPGGRRPPPLCAYPSGPGQP